MLDKYERLLDLRLDAARARSAGPSSSASPRDVLRAIARQYPGALRELDILPLSLLEHRVRVAREVAAGGEPPLWYRVIDAYHAELREVLAARARTGDRSIHTSAKEVLGQVAAGFGLSERAARELLYPRA